MPIRVLLLGLVLAVTACGSTSSAQSGGPNPVGNQSAPCDNQYLPVKAGAKWTYNNVSAAAGTVVQSQTITSVGADSFTVVFDAGSNVTWSETWSCAPAGLVELQNGAGYLAAIASGPDGKATVTVKTNSGVTVPAHLNVGDTWTQAIDMTVGGSKATFEVKNTYSFKAVGMESVTVPFGTFDALRVDETVHTEVTTNGQTSPSDSTLQTWLVPGKGTVKSVGNFGGIVGSTELTALVIP